MKTIKLTNAQINAQIKRNNLAFKKATKAEKKVMIAKDVLARLKTGQYKANTGNWASFHNVDNKFDEWLDNNPEEASLQKEIIKGETCECCALGGLLASCVAINNNYSVDDYLNGGLEPTFEGDINYGESDKTGLNKLFTQKELREIEFCFESGNGATSYHNIHLKDEAKREKLLLFSNKYDYYQDLLKAIMENIVKNKGKFKP